jgi:tetratricopeptide (TPR) repeat protein
MTEDLDRRFDDRRSTRPQAYELYLLARHYAQLKTRDDNHTAIALYRQALTEDPDFALANVGLAAALLDERILADLPNTQIAEQVEPLLAAAEKTAPRLAEIYAVRGALRTDLRDRDGAITEFKRAVALNPNLPKAASELGYYYLVGGEPRESHVQTSRAALLDPMNANLHAQDCMALTDLAQFAAAQSACERARALSQDSMWTLSVTSSLEAARGALPDALQWIDRALAKDSSVTEMHGMRGDVLVHLGLLRDAGKNYDVVAASDPEAARHNTLLVYVALCAAVERGGTSALHAFVQEQKLAETEDFSLLFELANAELMVGDMAAAREYVRRALASPELTAEDLASAWHARKQRSYLLIAAVTEHDADAPASERHLAELAKLLDRLSSNGMRTSGVYALQAQLASIRGDQENALRTLDQAIALGWRDVWLAEHEPYFAALRQRGDFRARLEKIRKLNAADAAGISAAPGARGG